MPKYAVEIKKDEINPLILVKLDEDIFAEILFQGATLNSLYLKNENRLYGYELNKTIDFSDSRSSFLFPFPNRIRDGKYTFDGKNYHFPVNEPAKNNAIHGFLNEQIFDLVHFRSNENNIEIKLTYQYLGDREYYPFPFSVEVTYLFYQSNLVVNFRVTNTGVNRMPSGFGWHPYFKSAEYRVDDIVLKLPELQEIELDLRSIPVGTKRKYDHFNKPNPVNKSEFDSLYELKQLKEGLWWRYPSDKLKMEMIYDEAIIYLQLYTPSNRQSIAIEPMTCTIDAFNSGLGLNVLSPEDNFELAIMLKWN
jgi:aldose 1-epimerase